MAILPNLLQKYGKPATLHSKVTSHHLQMGMARVLLRLRLLSTMVRAVKKKKNSFCTFANCLLTKSFFFQGSSLLRAGWSFDKTPRVSIPAIVARYRDRKLGRSCMYVGWDAYADATTRGQIRYAFEPGTGIVSNWDVMEGVLDYTFLQMGLGDSSGIDRPVVMTEPVANLSYSRKSKL
jgi:hypothetical protein